MKKRLGELVKQYGGACIQVQSSDCSIDDDFVAEAGNGLSNE